MILPAHIFNQNFVACITPSMLAQCVHWYLGDALSFLNLEEMMTKHGISVEHYTLHSWVIRVVPLLHKAFAVINVPWVAGGEWMKPQRSVEIPVPGG